MHSLFSPIAFFAVALVWLTVPAAAAPAGDVEVFAQLGHSDTIHAVAISPDGRFLASGAGDKQVKVWDLASGREFRTLRGFSAGVLAVLFSRDSKTLFAAGWDPLIRQFDLATGNMVRTFKDQKTKVNALAMSPNGRFLGAAGDAESVGFWEISSGRFVGRFKGLSDVAWFRKKYGFDPETTSLAFTPDGKRAVVGSTDFRVRVIDLTNGTVERVLEGHNSWIGGVAVSPDGRWLLSGENATGGPVKLWDMKSGKLVRSIGEISNGAKTLTFFPDGRRFAVGHGFGASIWDLEGNKLAEFKLGYMSGEAVAAALTPDARFLAMGDRKRVRLYDIDAGTEVRQFTGRVATPWRIGFTADGRYLFVGDFAKMVRWDLETAAATHQRAVRCCVKGMIPVGNGRFLFGDKDVSVADVTSGERPRRLAEFDKEIGLSVAPAAGRAFVAAGDKAALIDLAGDGAVKKLTTGLKRTTASALSADGRIAAIGGTNVIHLLDIDRGKWVGRLRTKGLVSALAFSADGKSLLAATHQKEFALWRVVDGGRRIFFQGHKSRAFAVAVSPDGGFAASGHDEEDEGTIFLWDLKTGKVLHRLEGHRRAVRGLAISPDGRLVASVSWDGSTRLWDAASGRPVAVLLSFEDGEWLAVTPEGYYNASAAGDGAVNLRAGGTVQGIDAFRSTFFKPAVVEKAIASGDSRGAIDAAMGDVQNQPVIEQAAAIAPPFVVIKSPDDGARIDGRAATLSFHVEDRNQPLEWIKAYVNGRRVGTGETRGVIVKGNTGTAASGPLPEAAGKRKLAGKVVLALDAGTNVVEFVASNGFAESRTKVTVTATGAPAAKKTATADTVLPNLWILAIGINDYADKGINDLAYAANDAHGIVAAFETQKGRLFREVHSLILSDTSGTPPTRENIVDNLEFLGRAGHRDVVVLFIAGHGINDPRGNFYFLPSDAGFGKNGKLKRSRAVSSDTLREVLDLPARKIVLADTCHSQGVGGGKRTRGVSNDRLVKELQDANAVIFTSSRGNELSQEDDRWKHGAFTHALIKGLSGEADLFPRDAPDGRVTMKELDVYVSETVPQLTDGAQHPITNTPDGYVNFPVAMQK